MAGSRTTEISLQDAALRETLQAVRDRLPVLQVLQGAGIRVHRMGAGRHRALCPFHADSDPSLVVYPDGRWYCFGCAAAGDVVDLVWRLHGHQTFLDALEAASAMAGVEFRRGEVRKDGRAELFAYAVAEYAKALGKPALAYLQGRGFPEDFVRARSLGYSPGPDYLAARLRKAGYDLRAAENAGLVNPGGRDSIGGGYIVLPVSVGSKYVDLQGRAFPEDSARPRYKNLRGERKHLFGEDYLASRDVLLCEGIMDALSAQLAGLPAVATYGVNGFRPQWARKFARCETVYVCFDRDASRKAVEVARLFGVRGRVVSLPDSLGPHGDLNDLHRASGSPEKFAKVLRHLMSRAPTAYEVLIDSLECADYHTLYQHIAPLLAEIQRCNPISRQLLLRRLADKAGLAYEIVAEAAREAAEHEERLKNRVEVASPGNPVSSPGPAPSGTHSPLPGQVGIHVPQPAPARHPPNE